MMFQRLFARDCPETLKKKIHKGFFTPETGQELLGVPHRQQMIKMLWDTTSLTHTVFDEYLLAPIQRYAELVQLLPASESHHHAYAGGMLDHALEAACYGLKLRQRHLLPPGAKPEDQSSAGELWNAAIVYGALMHDAAKVLVDIEVQLQNGQQWRLWHGPIPEPYRVRYRSGREYNLHSAINSLLCEQILGPNVLDWLVSQPKLFALLMYTISGHTERGGIIAELVIQADRASVAKALGGDPVRALLAPVKSIQRKLAEGLRYMVKEQFKLNQKGGVAWLTDEALWLVSPRAINELKAHLYAHGIKNIPADLNRLYGELQAFGLIEEVSEGKSVWKCVVSDGDWKQTFNMIKVSPTLIWPGETKPAVFSGELVPQGEGANIEKHPDASAIAQIPEPVSPLSKSDRQPAEVSLDDDILNLFPKVDDLIENHSKQKETTSFPDVASNKTVGNDTSTDITMGDTQSESSSSQVSNDLDDIGEQFWQWLKMGLLDHSIIINDSKAPVHIVEGTYFLVSPSIFKRFSTKVLNDEDQWKTVQRRFQKLGMHIKTQGRNIHTVSVEGPNKTRLLKGYLIKDPHQLSKKTPLDNRVLTLITSQRKDESNE